MRIQNCFLKGSRSISQKLLQRCRKEIEQRTEDQQQKRQMPFPAAGSFFISFCHKNLIIINVKTKKAEYPKILRQTRSS
jgi:hypothetical protein